MVIVPPGGFAGFGQMTPASQRALFRPSRSGGGGRRRKRKSTRARVRAGGRKRAKSSRKIKFGSPAWRRKYKLDK